MDNDKREQMYYADIIASMAEKTIRRLWIALIVAFLVIASMLSGFLWFINQYDFVSYSQDGSGLNVIGDNSGNEVRFNGADVETDSAYQG